MPQQQSLRGKETTLKAILVAEVNKSGNEREKNNSILHENKEIKYQEKAWISKVLDRLQRSSG